MEKPYYLEIKNPRGFPRYYLGIYKKDYSKTRVAKVTLLFPKLNNKSVIDVGCAGGFYSLASHRKGCKDITLMTFLLWHKG